MVYWLRLHPAVKHSGLLCRSPPEYTDERVEEYVNSYNRGCPKDKPHIRPDPQQTDPEIWNTPQEVQGGEVEEELEPSHLRAPKKYEIYRLSWSLCNLRLDCLNSSVLSYICFLPPMYKSVSDGEWCFIFFINIQHICDCLITKLNTHRHIWDWASWETCSHAGWDGRQTDDTSSKSASPCCSVSSPSRQRNWSNRRKQNTPVN